MKRSAAIVLTLVGLPLGAAALGEAFPGQEVRRNLYPDRAACERDYSPVQCEPRGSGGGSSTTGGAGSSFRGPAYYANRNLAEARSDPGSGRTGQVSRTESSMRGGFGSFGRTARAGA